MVRSSGKASASRRAAREVLTQVRERDAFARPLIDEAVRKRNLSASDAGFMQVLVYGVVSTQGVLDDLIDVHASRPEAVGDKIRDALRIAAYELVFLGKEPHAAVNEGVELVRWISPKAAGFANAVLRKIAAEAEEFPFGDPEKSDDACARSCGFPYWMAYRIIDDMGFEDAWQLMRASNGQAPVYLGVNRFVHATDDAAVAALAAEGVEVERTCVPGCLKAIDASAAVKSQALRDGGVVVSDLASQLVAMIAQPRTTGPFLEVGSGRGTKTVLLQGAVQARFGKPAQVFSVDNRSFKAELLAKRMKELHVPQVTACRGDATALSQIDGLPRRFEGVFVDAPCSGLGTLRRHPEERWRLIPEDVDRLSDVQGRLLTEAARVCETGTRLVYATCTVLRQENEDVVEAFLDSKVGRHFEIVPVGSELPEELRGWETPEGFLRTRTSDGGPDAHFAAVLKRTW